MSNWFKKSQSMNETHDSYGYNMRATVWLPKGMSSDVALEVLTKMVWKIEGDTSLETPGVDANIQVENISPIENFM